MVADFAALEADEREPYLEKLPTPIKVAVALRYAADAFHKKEYTKWANACNIAITVEANEAGHFFDPRHPSFAAIYHDLLAAHDKAAQMSDESEDRKVALEALSEEFVMLDEQLSHFLIGPKFYGAIKDCPTAGNQVLESILSAFLDVVEMDDQGDAPRMPLASDCSRTFRGLRLLIDPLPYQFVGGSPKDVMFVFPYGDKKKQAELPTLAGSKLKAGAAVAREVKNTKHWVVMRDSFLSTLAAAREHGEPMKRLFDDMTAAYEILKLATPSSDEDPRFQQQCQEEDDAMGLLHQFTQQLETWMKQLRPNALGELLKVATEICSAIFNRLQEDDRPAGQKATMQSLSFRVAIVATHYPGAVKLMQSLSEIVHHDQATAALAKLNEEATAAEAKRQAGTLTLQDCDGLLKSYNDTKALKRDVQTLEKLHKVQMGLIPWMVDQLDGEPEEQAKAADAGESAAAEPDKNGGQPPADGSAATAAADEEKAKEAQEAEDKDKADKAKARADEEEAQLQDFEEKRSEILKANGFETAEKLLKALTDDAKVVGVHGDATGASSTAKVNVSAFLSAFRTTCDLLRVTEELFTLDPITQEVEKVWADALRIGKDVMNVIKTASAEGVPGKCIARLKESCQTLLDEAYGDKGYGLKTMLSARGVELAKDQAELLNGAVKVAAQIAGGAEGGVCWTDGLAESSTAEEIKSHFEETLAHEDTDQIVVARDAVLKAMDLTRGAAAAYDTWLDESARDEIKAAVDRSLKKGGDVVQRARLTEYENWVCRIALGGCNMKVRSVPDALRKKDIEYTQHDGYNPRRDMHAAIYREAERALNLPSQKRKSSSVAAEGSDAAPTTPAKAAKTQTSSSTSAAAETAAASVTSSVKKKSKKKG
eukprot:TRINITY_DN41907_c0_g2_i1.p1 TRINITY_DN41907_c0_g2~~TRINITY_DN41907_c0_g2_i1.p1  ORF type:complete len:912 (-),score=289.18 TRINITY_DN41907_c0_g2_i1:196-2841(-)